MAKVDKNKIWVKMILVNKRGRLLKLIEDLNDSRIEMIDISVTTIEGAYLVTATLQVRNLLIHANNTCYYLL